MKIAFDIEPFFRNRAGVGRYVEGLLGAWSRSRVHRDSFTLFRSKTYAGLDGVPGLEKTRVEERVLPRSHKALQAGWLLAGAPSVEKYVGEHDVYYSPGVPAFPTRGKLVIVIFDLVWRKFPQFYPRYSIWTRRIGYRRALKQCAGIVTISEASRRDILEFTGFDKRRVRAIHLGINESLRRIPSTEEVACVLTRLGVDRPYILAIAGDNSPKKNLGNLVRAVATLPSDLHGVKLVTVGQPKYDVQGLTRLIEKSGMSGRVQFLGRVMDEDLRSLYAGARLTAYPSFYEGFGFPIVESMSLGTPVVTSNVSSMSEIGQGATVLVDPNSPDAISHAIDSLLRDDTLHRELREKGFERAAQFTWETCAARTREFVEELIRR